MEISRKSAVGLLLSLMYGFFPPVKLKRRQPLYWTPPFLNNFSKDKTRKTCVPFINRSPL